MASHYAWYPSSSEVVVPFNARYSFPSQANKAVKMTPRIPPKNASTFNPGGIIRLEFPAQGYVNPSNTTLEFDVQLLYTPVTLDYSQIRFQNNIQSLFSRVRLLYGSTPIEDIIGYNQIVRSLTEWTASSQTGTTDQTSINEGIGGIIFGSVGNVTQTGSNTGFGNVHVRKNLIHGIDLSQGIAPGIDDTQPIFGSGGGAVPNGPTAITIASHPSFVGTNPVRRYQVQLALGMFNQEKLIPTKFMASQLAVEITLATAAECIILEYTRTTTVADPTYQILNVNLIPEILEFDASYDESFIKGLMDGGVPIKFSTWNNYKFSTGGATNVNLQIQERSRSVKAIFAMQRRDPATITTDSGASFFTTDLTKTNGQATTFNEYQFRIGGRYYPAAPVQCSTDVGGQTSNGGAEAWVELSKALNILGDYRLNASVNTVRWAVGPGWARAGTVLTLGNSATTLNEFDYKYDLAQYGAGGLPSMSEIMKSGVNGRANSFAGFMGSSCFAMAIDLETSQGTEISGLNAEEQSDISLIARYSAAQASGFIFDVFTYIDSMIVLRENNVNPFNIGFGINSIIFVIKQIFTIVCILY